MSKFGKPVWQYVYDAAKQLNGPFTPMDIIRKVHEVNTKVPEVTIRAYVIAMAPNHPSSHHYPSTRKLHGFFNYLGGGHFKLLDATIDNPEEEEIDQEEIAEEDIGTAIHLEEDLEDNVAKNLTLVESGLKPYENSGRQFSIESGRIDILATDKEGNLVVLELKAGTGNDAVLTQVLSYMATLKKDIAGDKKVRGIIVAHDFSDRLIKAASLVENLKLVKYKVNFSFESIEA
jgi:hypothetical protein